jgi:hypothetical protein
MTRFLPIFFTSYLGRLWSGVSLLFSFVGAVRSNRVLQAYVVDWKVSAIETNLLMSEPGLCVWSYDARGFLLWLNICKFIRCFGLMLADKFTALFGTILADMLLAVLN